MPENQNRDTERTLTAGWPRPLLALVAILSERPDAMPALDPEEWRQFAALAIDRHRVASITLDSARESGVALPENVADALSATARQDGAGALRQKAESFRLVSALTKAGCEPVILKGWPLAEEFYGSAGLRHSKDIDLYIAPEEIDLAIETLSALGYGADMEHEARMPHARQAAFQAEYNDLSFWHPASHTQVEVHWRNYHFRGWPELRDLPGAFAEHALDRTGRSVRVLSPKGNLVYLSMHGQQHLWLRLKWCLDIARLAEARGEAGLMEDLEFARQSGACQPVVLGVRLAHAVFGSPLPRQWPEPSPAGQRALLRFARLIASDDAAPGGLTAKLEYYRTALGLAETLPQRMGVLRYLIWRRFRLGWLRGRLAPV